MRFSDPFFEPFFVLTRDMQHGHHGSVREIYYKKIWETHLYVSVKACFGFLNIAVVLMQGAVSQGVKQPSRASFCLNMLYLL